MLSVSCSNQKAVSFYATAFFIDKNQHFIRNFFYLNITVYLLKIYQKHLPGLMRDWPKTNAES